MTRTTAILKIPFVAAVSLLGAPPGLAQEIGPPPDPIVVLPPAPSPQAPMAFTAASSFALPSGVAVGRTPGAFAVSPQGQATYTIPLWTPAGIAGVQPSLALNYSSTFSNGLLGVGWTLSGLSAITRCFKTVAQNGVAGPPSLTSSDVFCLDGNSLRSFGGTTYGADGAQYQTELADFSLVISHGSLATGPTWFEVHGKNGLIYQYGNTTDSELIANGTAPQPTIRWALNRVSDRFGNYLTVSYTNDSTNHVLRPNLIAYTTSPGATVSPQYNVVFGYETPRANSINWYYAGTLSQETNRLNQVSIQANNGSGTFSAVKTYSIAYGAGETGLDRITSVTECSPTQCFPATTIGYQDATSGFGSQSTVSGVPTTATGLQRLDVNADGIDDLIYQNGGTYYYLLGQASGTFAGPYSTGIINPASGITGIDFYAKNRADLLFKGPSGNFRVCTFASAGAAFTCIDTATAYVSPVVGDFDGDGYQDIGFIDAYGGVGYYSNQHGSGLLGAEIVLYAIDQGESLSSLQSTGSAPSSHRLHDFNGDGRDDFVVYRRFCLAALQGGSCTSSTFKYYWMSLVSAEDGSFVVGGQLGVDNSAPFWTPIFGDFNGDGCADMITPNKANGDLQVSFGACDAASLTAFSTTAVTTLLASSYSNTKGGFAVDFNADRRDDVLLYNISSAAWGYAISSGSNLGAWTAVSPTLTSVGAIGDFNGDGLQDIAGLVTTLTYRTHSGVAGDLATSFVDGFGVSYNPSYASIAGSATYTRGSSAIYPDADYAGPVWVTTSYSASNGIGGTYSVGYTYSSAFIGMQGRGFEAFGVKTAHDSRNNLYTKEQYAHAFPQTGMIVERTVLQSDGVTPVSDTLYSNTSVVLDSTTNNQRYFVFPSSVSGYTYEVGGAINGHLITQRTTTTAFTGPNGYIYGNPSQIITTTTDKDSTSPWNGHVFTDTVNITPLEVGGTSSTGWCIHLPSQVSETRMQPDGTALTHTTAYAVNTNSECEIDGKTIEPSSTIDKVATVYQYTDHCGNINEIDVTGQTVAGVAMPARTTKFGFGTHCIAPESITNALTQLTQIGYQYDLGLEASVTDPNNLPTSWTYNDIGQKTLEQRSDGTQTSFTRGACVSPSYCGDTNLRYSVTRTENDNTTGHAQYWTGVQYFDQFDRIKDDNAEQSNGVQATVQTAYDALGRVSTRSNPYGNGFSEYLTTYVYDVLSRLTQQYRPISSTNSTLQYTNYTYQGRTSTVQDPKLYTTTRKSDVIGELALVIDPDTTSTTAYAYDPFGALKSITDPQTNQTSRTYDPLGYLLVGTSDADRGSWTYQYDSLGELVNVRDAKTLAPNWTQQLTYDPLGRLAKRVESEGTTNWTWGSSAAAHDIGRLNNVAGLGNVEAYTYDNVGRPATHTETWNSINYVTSYGYNSIGKLDTVTYPSTPLSANAFQVKYGYTDGFLSSIQNYTGNVAGTTFWALTPGTVNMDPWGHVLDETVGTTSAVRIRSAYDPDTSWISSRQVGSGGSTNNLQNLSYSWDTNGNLSERQDLNQTLAEVFNYDNLNRIQTSTLNGNQNLSVTITNIGNILQRVEGGTTYNYSYDPTHKHAVSTVNSVAYGYDANGNMSTRNGSLIFWNSANQPTTINSGSVSSAFSYGADRQRKQQTATYTAEGDNGTETTTYVGGLMEIEATPAQVHYKHFVQVPGGTQIIYDLQSMSGTQVTYITADHLGSGNLFLSSAGTAEINESYSAYGYRRSSNWSAPLPTSSSDYTTIASTTRRGYTDAFHEMLDNVGLIHMNGRVYDPVIARFLSADSVVAEVGNSQSLNPYSYVQNRPLTLTDPTGLLAKKRRGTIHRPTGSGGFFARHPWFLEAGDGPGRGDAMIAAQIGRPTTNNIEDGMGGLYPAMWANVGHMAAAVLDGFTGADGAVTSANLYGSTLPQGARVGGSSDPATSNDGGSSVSPEFAAVAADPPSTSCDSSDCMAELGTTVHQVWDWLVDNTSVSVDFHAADGVGVTADASTDYNTLSQTGAVDLNAGATTGAGIDGSAMVNLRIINIGDPGNARVTETYGFTIGALGGFGVSASYTGRNFSMTVSGGFALGAAFYDTVTTTPSPLQVFH